MINSDLNNLEWFVTTIYDSWNIILDIAFNVTILASLYGPTTILLVVPALRKYLALSFNPYARVLRQL